MYSALILMVGLALVLAAVAYRREPHLLIEAARSGGGLFLQILPMLLIAFFVAGLVDVLLPRDLIAHWVGRESGVKGLLIATCLGAVTPGGPFVQFPVVASLYKAGADVGPLVAYLSAWALIGLNRVIIYEIPLLGPQLTFVRLVCSFAFPPIIGFVARQVFMRVS